MRVHKADRREAGACNFCTSRHIRVIVVQSDRGMQVRFCDYCLAELRMKARVMGYGR